MNAVKVAFFVTFVFLFFTLTNSVCSDTDILGWEKAKWGMTQSEVKELYDIDWVKDSPPRCAMKEKVNIQNHKFTVVFWFKEQSPSGKLYKITMSEGEFNQICPFYNVVQFFVSKYGEPDKPVVKSTTCHCETKWSKHSGQLEIKLTTVDITGRPFAICDITYTAVGDSI